MNHQFDTLIEISKKRCDEAAQRLGIVMAQARDSENKCNTLSSYRDDYRTRLDNAVREGVDSTTLRNFRGFLVKLDEAVKQQSAESEHWRQTVETARQLWQEEEKRMRSYSLIQERRLEGETRRAIRVEQKQQDEFAARRFSTASHGMAFGH